MKYLAMGLAATVVVLLGATQGSVADDQADPADEKAIRDRNEAFVVAFNKGDIKAMAETYALDADFLSAEGKRVRGRAALKTYFAKGFADNKGLKLTHSDSSIRFLKPDVAIDVGTWEIAGRPGGKAMKGFYTAVWMKRDGKWFVVHDRPMVPLRGALDDFKIIARYDPGLSNWLRWQYTITADGKVAQEFVPGGRGGGERSEKQTQLSRDDIGALFDKVKGADFFELKSQYKGEVTDQPTLVLEVTMDRKTHQVLVYGYRHLKEKEDQDAVDRFLSVWTEVIQRVPAPNPDQKPDLYKPGNYGQK